MTLNMRSLCLAISGAMIAIGVSSALAESNEDAIRALRMQSNAAIAAQDADAVGSFIADDYVVTISSGVIERSREEHVSNFAAHFVEYPDVVYVRTPVTINVSDAYPLAIEHGTWVGSRTTKNGKLENGGEYTAAWRKTGQTWKIYSELFVGLYCRGEDC